MGLIKKTARRATEAPMWKIAVIVCFLFISLLLLPGRRIAENKRRWHEKARFLANKLICGNCTEEDCRDFEVACRESDTTPEKFGVSEELLDYLDEKLALPNLAAQV